MNYKSIKGKFLSLRVLSFAIVMGFALTANAQRECNRCQGKKKIPDTCAYCKGKGEKPCSICGGNGFRNCGFCLGGRKMKCSYCRGRGLINKDTEECPNCYGKKTEPCQNCSGSGKIPCPERSCRNGVVPCSSCNSTGIHWWSCPDCRGTGWAR